MRTLIENVYESELFCNKLEALRQKLDNYETVSSSSPTNTNKTAFVNKLNEMHRNESDSFSSSLNYKAKRRSEFMSQIDEETHTEHLDSNRNRSKLYSNNQKQQYEAVQNSVQTKMNSKTQAKSFSFKLDEKLYNSIVLFGCLVMNQFLSTFLLAKIYSCKFNFRF